MSVKKEVEFYLAINEDGDFEVDTDAVDVSTKLAENYGCAVCRIVKFKAKIAVPEIEEVEVEVPDTAGTVEAVAAE